MKHLVVATKNPGKAAEFRDFFHAFGINVSSLLDFETPMPDIEETGSTFKANAAIKAEQIAKVLNQTVIADDSGLVVDALDGKPGIFSARYAGGHGNDQKNVEKVLNELQNVPEKERTARFVCVLALALPGEETVFRTGYCEGKIVFAPRGNHGFGYDPIFLPDGYTKTMAELTSQEKNRISHRKHAFEQLTDWLKTQVNSD
ncbi:XTP/dITP diphosphatase [Lentibacillus sp. JNUCC-1]|uniref:XTP/dITP diphosphatase n=1 Tax=Lentibacillus sp. JNUCC-1 TaxID=2654513 RepID=UPI0012E7CD81|nr:XTP/dITP diphosphatase [Lentibacillus sp. JNUCC-1]MUV39404.1 XTP/dITP diphosphatase [Lentibacillus sp. JNUCC-1]